MDQLPQDPFMLLSMVNMKLRDGGYDSLDDLCAELGVDTAELVKRLADAGFEYLPDAKRFA